jgi:hypothetical protein
VVVVIAAVVIVIVIVIVCVCVCWTNNFGGVFCCCCCDVRLLRFSANEAYGNDEKRPPPLGVEACPAWLAD